MYQVRLSVIEVLGYPEPHMVVEVLQITKNTGSMHMICETVVLVLLGIFNKICPVGKSMICQVAQVMLYNSEQKRRTDHRTTVLLTVFCKKGISLRGF
jgi:hypothetical protein